MKIIHTADWHLGHKLHENSQLEEQALFLDWLQEYIQKEKVQVLLVSGDIFDNSHPSNEALNLYYDFLNAISQDNSPCKAVIITGGNHDSPGVLNAPQAVLRRHQIHIIGKATEKIEDEIFHLNIEGEELLVAAVPYLRDKDIRQVLEGERFENSGERYKKALIKHYAQLALLCEEKKNNTPCIAMGHLFAIGGSTSDSEQSIYVGNLGDIGAEDFPETFDYIALGHLHRPQKIAPYDHIRYSGSPYVLSFSEVHHKKRILLLETEQGKDFDIQNVDLPQFRAILQIKGSEEECLSELKELNTKSENDLQPWVELHVKDPNFNIFKLKDEIRAFENLQVLKISNTDEVDLEGFKSIAESSKSINDFLPEEVFEKLCEEKGLDLEENPEVKDLFFKAMNLAKNQ